MLARMHHRPVQLAKIRRTRGMFGYNITADVHPDHKDLKEKASMASDEPIQKSRQVRSLLLYMGRREGVMVKWPAEVVEMATSRKKERELNRQTRGSE